MAKQITENDINAARLETYKTLTGFLNNLRDVVLDIRELIREEREAKK